MDRVTRRSVLGGLLGAPALGMFGASATGEPAMPRNGPVVDTTAGRVRGRRVGDAVMFAGVPYAAAPVGARRFAAPQPPPAWPGIRDTTEPGPAAPQLVSRLEQVVGPIRLPGQSEDCLSVNVWTPHVSGRRPVLVWLHGGAYVAGAGGQDWYFGTGLAAREDLVVVTVNYRLGALGFLYPGDLDPDLGAGNAGLRDQIAAVRWVRDNIANFGGDPSRVTLAGQSAGALSALAMMSTDRARGLFGRVVLQSTPTGIAPASRSAATEVTERYLHLLGLRPGQVRRLLSLPVDQLLAAQSELMQTAPPLRLEPPFQLVADDELVADDLLAAPCWADEVDRLIGTTRDEAMAWSALDPRLDGIDRSGAIAVAADFLGDGAEAEYDRISESAPSATPRQVLTMLTTDFFFDRDIPRLARGDRSFVYRFDWHPDQSELAACHTIELPSVFGTLHAWREAPMLAGADPADQRRLVGAVRPAWGAFVRSGHPGHDRIPEWPRYADGAAVHRFDVPR